MFCHFGLLTLGWCVNKLCIFALFNAIPNYANVHYFFNHGLIDKRKPTAGVGWMEFIMSEVMERQAFRSEVVLKLLDTHNATVDELISSAKKIEHYVFQEHLTYYVANKIDREMLDSIAKGFIEGRERAFRQSEPSV